MPVTFDDIISTSSSEESFLQIFQNAFSQQGQPFLEAYRTILAACYRNPGLSPDLKGYTPEVLAQSWLRKYCKSYESRISRRISQPPRTVADRVVNTIINARLTGLTAEHLEQIHYAHRLSMSAENIQGLLLEEFLAEQLAEYGWYCCWGESVRHVDFCNIDDSLLQVKNRSNSENSSSSRVRINQPIEKWYRVDARTGLYRWSYFNEKYGTDRFSEETFIIFVQRVLTSNPEALAVEVKNPWQFLSQPSD
jgi:hypothetical protein